MRNFLERQSRILGRSAPSGVLPAIVFFVAAGISSSAYGTIDNTVTATGTPLGGPPDSIVVSASESVDVVDAINELQVVKTAIPNDEITADGFAEAGETITYTFDVTNTGNVTIVNARVDDTTNATNGPVIPGAEVIFNDVAPLNDSSDAAADGVWDTIAPGDTVRFTATYTVTQQDVDTLQ